MKKKGVLIAGAIGFVVVVSLFARQNQDIAGPSTTGGGGRKASPTFTRQTQDVAAPSTTGGRKSKRASKLSVPSGSNNEQIRAHYKDQLKDPNLTPEQKKVIREQIKDLK